MRIASLFARHPRGGVVIPFVTAGDPDPDATLEIMRELVANGADVVELGVPFSDPMADGPVIQKACERALKAGANLRIALDVVERFRREDRETPVVLMGYMNPFHRMGLANFARRAKQAGVDGVLAVDCPVECVAPLRDALRAENLDTILLISPTTSDERAERIFSLASGYVYYVSLKGVTGAATPDVREVGEKVEKFKKMTDLPIAVGFGIRSGETARAISRRADGVVIGSHLVEIVEKNPGDEARKVGRALKEIRMAVDSPL